MKLIKCFMKNSTWYKGARRKGKPVGVLWHDTAAGNPMLKRYVQPYETDENYDEMIALLGKNQYGNDWNHIDREAGLNAWIGTLADGSIATIQAGEWDIHAWGCGSGDKGSCNGFIKKNGKTTWVDPFWIQFEICDDNYQKGTNTKEYFDAVYKEACEFTAYICKQFNIDPKGTVEFNGVQVPTILCHKDSYRLGLGNDHSDIYKWFGLYNVDMNTVRDDVAKIIGPTPGPSPEIVAGDLVSIAQNATYWSGAAIPGWVQSQNWYVLQVGSNGRAVIDKNEAGTASIMSPIDVKFLTKVGDEATEPPVETPTPPVSEIPVEPPVTEDPPEENVATDLDGDLAADEQEIANIFIRLLKAIYNFFVKLLKRDGHVK